MKFHDADWYSRLIGFSAWRCRADGGWAMGWRYLSVSRLHRELPVEWTIGPMKFPARESEGRTGCGQTLKTMKGVPIGEKPLERHSTRGGYRLRHTIAAHDLGFAALLLVGSFVYGFTIAGGLL